MARGRMLNQSVVGSRKFNDLHDDTCRLMATWIISFLDLNGVFYGDPAMVRSYIFPRRSDISVEQVQAYLEEMERIGLIVLFKAKGDVWQHWPGFLDNQAGLRRERERTSFPEPPQSGGKVAADCRQDDGKLPATRGEVVRRTEQNGTELNTTEPGQSSFVESAIGAYQSTIGLVSGQHQRDEMMSFLQDLEARHADGWFEEAVKVAADQNHRSWAYVRGILKRCLDEGHPPSASNGYRPRERVVPKPTEVFQ